MDTLWLCYASVTSTPRVRGLRHIVAVPLWDIMVHSMHQTGAERNVANTAGRHSLARLLFERFRPAEGDFHSFHVSNI